MRTSRSSHGRCRRPQAWPKSCASGASTSTSAARPCRRSSGIIIADTKFEWGELDGRLILIDEVLTPDSSRFWPADRTSRAAAAVVRQAVCPRLAGDDRLGQKQPAADAARRRGGSNAREIYRSIRAAHAAQAFPWR